MKTSRYTDSQNMSLLKPAADGISVPDLCREHGMSSAASFRWRAR
ncbi:transposase [Desulfovibrio sp. DV]